MKNVALADTEISESWGFPGAQWSASCSLHLNIQRGWEDVELEVGYLHGSLCFAGSGLDPGPGWSLIHPSPGELRRRHLIKTSQCLKPL